jgi:hypothetical protein
MRKQLHKLASRACCPPLLPDSRFACCAGDCPGLCAVSQERGEGRSRGRSGKGRSSVLASAASALLHAPLCRVRSSGPKLRVRARRLPPRPSARHRCEAIFCLACIINPWPVCALRAGPFHLAFPACLRRTCCSGERQLQRGSPGIFHGAGARRRRDRYRHRSGHCTGS